MTRIIAGVAGGSTLTTTAGTGGSTALTLGSLVRTTGSMVNFVAGMNNSNALDVEVSDNAVDVIVKGGPVEVRGVVLGYRVPGT